MTVEELIKLPQIRFEELKIGTYFLLGENYTTLIFRKESETTISNIIASKDIINYSVISRHDQDVSGFNDFVIPLDSAQIELFLNTEKAKLL